MEWKGEGNHQHIGESLGVTQSVSLQNLAAVSRITGHKNHMSGVAAARAGWTAVSVEEQQLITRKHTSVLR